LASFDGFPDGLFPESPLLQASDGNLYGTALTVFRVTPSGTLTLLVNISVRAEGSLVQGTDGNIYGTTAGGVLSEYGSIFKLTLEGTVTTVYNFCSLTNCTDGETPEVGLVQDTNGSFYGTTIEGGTGSACSGGCGTIFTLSVGLGPFVETQPSFGKVGRTIKILGTNLTGATSVSFNGTPATFTMRSPSLISATVPEGATTGTVQVVTPSGTLSSNLPFRVAP
jgi:uncharacterized repeat protein (TIGR03803 family)